MSAGTDLAVQSDAEALAADPVGYMQVVLHRAKGWLTEARDIETVRETKAIAVGYESVIREKELAFDAQLSATEIVRRCERRIGELVREGQQAGTVLRQGQTMRRPGHHPTHAAWWRIVPRRNASDSYRRRFDTREEAVRTLAIMRRRRTHKVVAYNDVGKRLPDA